MATPDPLKTWLKDCQTTSLQLQTHLSERAARSLLLQVLVLKWEFPTLQTPSDFWRALSGLNQGRSAPKPHPCDLLHDLPETAALQQEWQCLPEPLWAALMTASGPATAPIALLPELLQSRFQRQEKGVFYTPGPLVDYLCKGALELHLHSHFAFSRPELHALLWEGRVSPPLKKAGPALLEHLAQLKICDPACGGGTLLTGILNSLQALEKQLNPAGLGSPINWLACLYGVEIDPLAAALTRWHLWKASGSPPTSLPQVLSGNPLAAPLDWSLTRPLAWPLAQAPAFDLILANPPYIGEKGHKDLFKSIKNGPFKRFYQARSDLAYYFFHLALEWSKDTGISAFLSTNYFLTASQAQALRADLRARAVVHKLTDFHEWRLFKGAQGQHNLVSFFEKGQNPQAPCKLLLCERTGSASLETLATVLDNDETQFKSSSLPQTALYDPQTGQMQQPIRLEILDRQLEGILAKLKSLPNRLQDWAHLHQGVVSGADRLTVRHREQHALAGEIGSGIFVLTQAEVAALGLSAHEKALLKPWFKNSDIAPWISAEQTEQSVIYTDRHSHLLPDNGLYQHLERFKPLLASRREVGQGRLHWWQLHWPRQAPIFEGPKLVIPQRHRTCLAAWNQMPWYASADVYFLTSPKAPENLFWLLAWLNGPLAWLWLSCEGKRKGKLLELYAQPLSELPVLPLPALPLWHTLKADLNRHIAPDSACQTHLWQLFFDALNLSQPEQQGLLQAWQKKSQL